MSKTVIIGAWHVIPDQNKLSLDSQDYFVEPLAMDVLVYFAKNPNKVISRDELVEHVWNGRVVGDHAIYRIINQIRKILTEDEGLSYITTIRKKGYQLNKEVYWQDAETPSQNATPTTDANQNSKHLAPPKKWLLGLTLPTLAVASWFGYGHLLESLSYRSIQPFNVIKPFSVLIGQEKDPSYSPNGKFIGYSHRAKTGRYFKLYIQSVDGESPVQVTTQPGDDFSPSWSPDGSELLFVRHLEGKCHIMKIKVDSAGAKPDKVVDCHASGLANNVVWGNGDYIYYTDSFSAVDPYKIYKYSIKTSKKEQLTNPETGKSKGDIHIALSNKEDQLAFTRDLNWGSTQVKLLNLKTKETQDLFNLNDWRKALTWSFDDQYIYHIDEDDNINAYSIKHGFHKKVLENSGTLHSINSHRSEDKLSIMTGETGIDIWGSHLEKSQDEKPFIESSEIDLYPELAHNSNDVAFMSLRSGQPQIWIRSNGGKEYQLSKFTDGRSVQRIRWSPDDTKILSSVDNRLYIIDVKSRAYQNILEFEESLRIETASWSIDGNAVYFSSDVDGDWQIYKQDLNTKSDPIKVTDKGGYSPELTKNGDLLYYKYHQDGIWMMSMETKVETKLINDSNVFAYDALYARGTGFYYISVIDTGNKLKFYDLLTGNIDTIQSIKNPLLDYTISSDESRILYPKLLNEETEIKVLERK